MNHQESDRTRWRVRKKTHVTGVTYNHRLLWSAAQRLLGQADEDPERRWYEYLSALVLCSFAFEGLLNYLGEELFSEEWADERQFFRKGPERGTEGKLTFLGQRLAVDLDRSRRPYQSFRELLGFRNAMAHVRHERVDGEVVTSVEEIGRMSSVPALAKRDAAHQIIGDLVELGDQLLLAAVQKGLKAEPDARAFTGTIAGHSFDDIP